MNLDEKPQCQCSDSFSGLYCQISSLKSNPCIKNSCSNGKECISLSQTQYSCSCLNKNCPNFLSLGCSKINCQNNGHCHLDSFGRPYCICQYFTGLYCQLCMFDVINNFII